METPKYEETKEEITMKLV